jgi:uncharacterized protein (TIGR00661 family)
LKNSSKFNNISEQKSVLVAPLDWGLGHATRCIPIINELLRLKCKVFIVADGRTFLLLKREFPQAVFLRCKGYEIRYHRDKRGFALAMYLQMPKIVFTIFREHRWLRRIVKEHQIDAVISDNRFGMYEHNIPCVYITHQLFIKTGSNLGERIAQKIHYFFIRKFRFCWVPDFRENGLAGSLSHPKRIPDNAIYIGPLSRFKKMQKVEKAFDLLVSISGPEPQRSIFEKIILNELKSFQGTSLLVRGLPGEKEIPNPPNLLVKIVNHLPQTEFNKAIAQSEMVICRSGYTSVMDMVKLQKKAILIPTPGQTEQEYLAKYLSEKKYFYSETQEGFNLRHALKNASEFPAHFAERSEDDYKKTIAEFVLSLKTGNFAPQ